MSRSEAIKGLFFANQEYLEVVKKVLPARYDAIQVRQEYAEVLTSIPQERVS